jgi:uracil-DNA glycosylase
MIESQIKSLKTDWKNILLPIFEKYSKQITSVLEEDSKKYKIFPEDNLIFNCFNFFNVSDLKVLIIAQDPYIHYGEAMGLAFSVPENCKIPPSLRNIFKELQRCYNKERTNPDLSDWAKQGVLLLNIALTVKEGESGSHIEHWADFTEDVVKYITSNCKGIVYIHWGNHAKYNSKFVDISNNLLLEWTHPSPLSRKPFDNNHFVLCNKYLKEIGKEEIKWI